MNAPVTATCASCGLPGHRYGRNEGPDRYDPMACINTLRSEVERLRALVNEHHNVAPWLAGSEAQRRVGIALWGTLCAVCAAQRDGGQEVAWGAGFDLLDSGDQRGPFFGAQGSDDGDDGGWA